MSRPSRRRANNFPDQHGTPVSRSASLHPQVQLKFPLLKSGAKAAAVQTLREHWPSPNRAKRLDCGRFTAAFPARAKYLQNFPRIKKQECARQGFQQARQSGAKATAVQTLREHWPSPNRAKRLDCGRFTAAFPRFLETQPAIRNLPAGPFTMNLETTVESATKRHKKHKEIESSPLGLAVKQFTRRVSLPRNVAFVLSLCFVPLVPFLKLAGRMPALPEVHARIPQQNGSRSSSNCTVSAFTNAVPVMTGEIFPAARSSQ